MEHRRYKKIYSNLVIIKNEDNIDEICFKDKKIAERFVSGAIIMWKMFQSRNSTSVCEGNNPPNDNYFINLNVKKRYINPLVNEKRIVDISNNARTVIDDFLNIKTSKYW